MKHKILIITMPFIAGICMGQNIQNTYLDAVKLVEYHTPPYPIVDIAPILNNYQITDLKDANPFFKALKLERVAVDKIDRSGSGTPEKLQFGENLIPSEILGADWQTTFINGLADFMAARFQAEIVHSGLDQAFTRMRKEDASTVKALFPKTFKQLEQMYNLDEPNSYYTSDLLFLRQLIISDLEDMPENVFQSELLMKNMSPKEHDLLLSGFNTFKYAKQGFSIDKILEKLSRQKFQNDDVKASYQLAYLLEESLKYKEGSTTKWINPILNLDLAAKPTSLADRQAYCYFGLLYEQLRNTKYYLKIEKMSMDEFAESIRNAAQFINKLNDAYDIAEQHKFKFTESDPFLAYVSTLTEGFESFMSSTLVAQDKYMVDLLGKYKSIAKPFIQKQYQQAIPIMVMELADYLTDNGEVRYIHSVAFLTQLATAKDEVAIETAIKAYALPIGGSAIKRHCEWNLSVNGYAGLAFGRERAYTIEGHQNRSNVGLSAPIGLTYTYDKISIFASVVDLGTLVNARINNDTAAISKVKIQNFIAPGLGLFYNFPKSPISVGFYYSYVPSLRTVKLEKDIAGQSNVSVSRYNLAFLVDIPLYTIMNKDRNNRPGH